MKVLNLYSGKKVYYDKKGYAIVWVDGKNKKVHVLEWEKHNGQKPDGYDIHHKDENKANWQIENLMLVSRSDHYKIHAGWIMENGVWTKKPCKDCKQLIPLDQFYQRKGLTPSNRCKPCSSTYFKNRGTEEYREKRKEYMKSYYQNNKQKWDNY